MGEVYRARDTKLRRDVALKVLPDEFANGAERMMRFEREAQVLASLNHPNIATIYGLEESNNIRALIMELVEGPTLEEQIGERAMPLDEALPICGFRTKWGTDSDGKWGAVSNEVGRGFDGKWGTFGLAVVTVPHFLRNGAPSISERCPTSIGTGGQG